MVHLHRALELFTDVGGTRLATDDAGAAREHWQRALRLLEELGHPDAAGVRSRLEALPRPDPS